MQFFKIYACVCVCFVHRVSWLMMLLKHIVILCLLCYCERYLRSGNLCAIFCICVCVFVVHCVPENLYSALNLFIV